LCFRLPAGLDTHATAACVSAEWASWPDSIPPLSETAEKDMVLPLIARLNEAFDLSLDLDPCLAGSVTDIRGLQMQLQNG
jgi:hypothetical protein